MTVDTPSTQRSSTRQPSTLGPTLTVAEVLETVDRELESPTLASGSDADPLAGLRRQIAEFRREPFGGRLVFLKRLAYWFVASSFDRQTKILESMVDHLDRLAAGSTRAVEDRGRSPSPVRSGGSLELSELSAESLERVLDADAELLGVERVLLYSLVFGLRPQRVLEIGTFKGGSADVMVRRSRTISIRGGCFASIPSRA